MESLTKDTAAVHPGSAGLRLIWAATAAAIVVAAASGASAEGQGSFGAVIRIERSAFGPDAGMITFSEFALGASNPVYPPASYGAPGDGVSVSFGGHFEGQWLSSTGQCPPGANPTGCVTGTPIAPLQLAKGAPPTFIAPDGSNPTSPSLSGSPVFNGPVSFVFDKDVAGVGLAGGYFDVERSTAIQAFDRRGNLIGGVANISLGMEYLALVTEDGSNAIAGVQFSLVGPEPAGYGIDELSFALARQIRREQVPGLKGAAAAAAVAVPDQPVEAPTVAAKPKQKGSLNELFKTDPAKDAGAAKADAPKGSLTDLFK